MEKRRLDTLLAERGLFPSRSRAAASVMAGRVRIGPGERRAAKPGEMVAVDEALLVSEQPPYVSRGGVKLQNALDATGIAVGGRRRSTSAPPPAASPTACCSAAPPK
jgi:23S rRNA (cytidine1920-2'-O)/16S rRNA (cytidine1409-2'-O)-methyltransferase